MGLCAPAPGTECDGYCDGLFARCQQVAVGVQMMSVEKSTHCVRLGFECSIRMNMLHIHVMRVECGGNKQSSVAVERFPFRAHKRYSTLRRGVDHSGESLAEALCLGNLAIVHVVSLVAGGVFRSATEFAAEVQVFDSSPPECGREGFAVELRVEAAVRGRTHVGERIDAVSAQQVQKHLYGVVGMPDRKDLTGMISRARLIDVHQSMI